MKKETEKTIKTFDDLRDALKPLISKRDEAQKRIFNVKTSLRVHEVRLETTERKLAEFIGKMTESIAKGEPSKLNDAIFAGKAERTDILEWIYQLKNETIPEAQITLDAIQKELETEAFKYLDIIREISVEKTKELLDRTISTWAEYRTDSLNLVKELGILIPSSLFDKLNLRIGDYFF